MPTSDAAPPRRDASAGRSETPAEPGTSGAHRLILTSGTGVIGTGRFLLGSKTDPAGRRTGEEWLVALFVPVVPRRHLALRTEPLPDGGLLAVVEGSGRLSPGAVAGRGALSLAGIAAVLFTLALIHLTSSNTGLGGGLLVVSGGGLLVSVAGWLDWLRPRIRSSRVQGHAAQPGPTP